MEWNRHFHPGSFNGGPATVSLAAGKVRNFKVDDVDICINQLTKIRCSKIKFNKSP